MDFAEFPGGGAFFCRAPLVDASVSMSAYNECIPWWITRMDYTSNPQRCWNTQCQEFSYFPYINHQSTLHTCPPILPRDNHGRAPSSIWFGFSLGLSCPNNQRQESSILLTCSTWDPGGSIAIPPLHQTTHTFSNPRPPPVVTSEFFIKRWNTISTFRL